MDFRTAPSSATTLHTPRVGSGITLAVGAAILPPLAVFAPLGAAALLAILALALLALDGRSAIARCRPLRTLAILLGLLTLWGLLSASWSILPLHSLVEGLRFLAISAAGLVILGAALAAAPAERERICLFVALGVVTAIALLAVERFSDAALTRFALRLAPSEYLPFARFDRGATVVVLALWPALFGTWARFGRAAALLLALAAIAIVLLLESTTAKFALAASLLAFAISLYAPRLIATALAMVVLAIAILLPLATPSDRTIVTIEQQAPWLKESAVHRLLIWRFAADRIAERPLLGWGMDASRELPGGHLDLRAAVPGLVLSPGAQALPLHPHDAALQWEVELGVPGTLLCLAILGWGLWRVGFAASLSRQRRAAALAWAAAALPVAMLSFGIWQEWWLSCLWLTATMTSATGYSRMEATEPGA
jgi:exopolysaccharide production protein ExoQ